MSIRKHKIGWKASILLNAIYIYQILDRKFLFSFKDIYANKTNNYDNYTYDIEIFNLANQCRQKSVVASVTLIGPKAQIKTYYWRVDLEGPDVPYLSIAQQYQEKDKSRMVKGIGWELDTYAIERVRNSEKLSLSYQTMNIDDLSSSHDEKDIFYLFMCLRTNYIY